MTHIFKTKKPMFGIPAGTLLKYDPSSSKYTLEGTKVWFFFDELVVGNEFFEEDLPTIEPVTFPTFTPVPLKKGKSFIYYSLQTNSWDSATFNPSNPYHIMLQSMGLAMQESEGNYDKMDNIHNKIRNFITELNVQGTP